MTETIDTMSNNQKWISWLCSWFKSTEMFIMTQRYTQICKQSVLYFFSTSRQERKTKSFTFPGAIRRIKWEVSGQEEKQCHSSAKNQHIGDWCIFLQLRARNQNQTGAIIGKYCKVSLREINFKMCQKVEKLLRKLYWGIVLQTIHLNIQNQMTEICSLLRFDEKILSILPWFRNINVGRF